MELSEISRERNKIFIVTDPDHGIDRHYTVSITVPSYIAGGDR